MPMTPKEAIEKAQREEWDAAGWLVRIAALALGVAVIGIVRGVLKV